MEILLIVILIASAWFWLDSIGSREAAIQHGSALVDRTNLQLLDETVACTRLRLGRNSRGRVQLLRTYEFDVSAHGSDRMACQLQMLGRQLHSWHIPPYLQAVH